MSYEYPYMENESGNNTGPYWPGTGGPATTSITSPHTHHLTPFIVDSPSLGHSSPGYLRWLEKEGGKGCIDINIDLLLALYSDGQEIFLKVKEGHGCPRDAVFMGFLLPGQNGWNPGRPDVVRILFSAASLGGVDPWLVISARFTIEDGDVDDGEEKGL